MVEIAKAMCPNNVEHRCSHIAFLVKKNKILNIGWNKNKTVPITTKHPYHDGMVGRHAEVDVIFRSQREDFKGYKIVVLRVSKETKKLSRCQPQGTDVDICFIITGKARGKENPYKWVSV